MIMALASPPSGPEGTMPDALTPSRAQARMGHQAYFSASAALATTTA